MIPTFAQLSKIYAELIDAMIITEEQAVSDTAYGLLRIAEDYEEASAKANIPIAVLMALNERAAGSSFRMYLGNDETFLQATTRYPHGRGPFNDWTEAAIDTIDLDGMDQLALNRADWTLELAAYAIERFRGFGYMARGILSPDNWAGTNLYQTGKFVRGQFEPLAVDSGIGCIPLIEVIGALNEDFKLPRLMTARPWDKEELPAAPIWATAPADAVKRLQSLLNKAAPEGQHDLIEDGNYGFRTRMAVIEFADRNPPPAHDGEFTEDLGKRLIRAVAAEPKSWLNGTNVELMQLILNEFGQYPKLIADGNLGPLTFAAICAFQETHNLMATGAIDQETIEAVVGKVRSGL